MIPAGCSAGTSCVDIWQLHIRQWWGGCRQQRVCPFDTNIKTCLVCISQKDKYSRKCITHLPYGEPTLKSREKKHLCGCSLIFKLQPILHLLWLKCMPMSILQPDMGNQTHSLRSWLRAMNLWWWMSKPKKEVEVDVKHQKNMLKSAK